ncbi:MAG TPA: dihydropteroate synthase [Armatimonadota bacterium]|nr:dihydropteroate synthase [Armatimonadota bacterium]
MRRDTLRARVLDSLAADEVLAELHARGSDKSAVEMILSRGLGRAMLVGPLPLDRAQALRQAAKAAGALAVLAKTAGRADPSRAEVILMGSMDELSGAAASVGGDIGARMEAALQSFAAPVPRVLRCRDREIALGEKTLVMGIINLTPDSFSGDGVGSDVEAAIAQGKQMVADGADMLDIGGESTRPGSEPVGEEDELRRVLPVIEGLTAEVDVPLSIDTYKSRVARAALEAGAHIVNDISGLHADEETAKVAAAAGAGVVIMHIRGTPRDMQKDPKYADVIGEISDYLEEGMARAAGAGITREQLILDPGIGFGKTLEHNLEILRRLRELRSLGCPLLVGTSRKSMIGAILDLPADQRLEGTAATVALAIAGGADIVRVHDVREMSRVAKVADAIVRVTHEFEESDDHQWADKPKKA